MAITMQQIADRVRARVRDNYQNEVDDTAILEILNDGVKVLYNERPDFFIGMFSATPLVDKLLSEDCPLPDENVPHLINYAVAIIEVQPSDEKNTSGAEQRFVRGIHGN